MTQWYPLVIIAYGVGILPLIKNLKQELHGITYRWYNDNSGSLGKFIIIETYFNSLTLQGPGHRYYTKPFKNILIVHPNNLKAVNLFGVRHKFEVCMGTRYLSSYIGDDESKRGWLRERTETWEKNICTIRKNANIPRIFTSWWYARSNQSGYF